MYGEFETLFENAIQARDLALVLKLFDTKTLPSLAAGVLGLRDNTQNLMERVERLLGDKEKGAKLRSALSKYLPVIPVPSTTNPTQISGAQQPSPPIAPAPA
jgi:hypothetical protein